MSKRSKKRARKRKQHRPAGLVLMCDACLKVQPVTPDGLMDRLAEALNALEQAGMHPKVRREFIIAEGVRGGGFILPPLGESGWTKHMQTYNPAAHFLARREDEIEE